MENTKKKVGQFQAYELNGFRLHVYNSNDVMADTSFIIEGEKGLVVMEYPLFKVNAAEFGEYIKALGKPIVTDITDYHLGGSDQLPIVMPEGMPAFIEGPIYGGMMKGFAQSFGDTMVDLPTQKATEVPFGSTQNYAGVDFRFEHELFPCVEPDFVFRHNIQHRAVLVSHIHRWSGNIRRADIYVLIEIT